MPHCPECGSTDVIETAFNLYDGGDYECNDCNIEFYYGVTKRDIYKKDTEEDI